MNATNGKVRTWLAAHWKVLVIVGGIALGVYAAMITAGFFLSRSPGFCGTCHYEQPFVKEWKESAHAATPCWQCHNSETVAGTIAQQSHNLWNTAKYFVGAYTYTPRAEVSDKACLKSGCHEGRALAGPVKFEHTIDFDHKGHLTGRPRGMELPCVACHSRIVQGEHMAVTKESCFLCHFKDMPKGVAIAGCKCHGAPDAPVTHKGFAVSHEKFTGLGMKCSDCHLEVTVGKGEVPPVRCNQCHLQQDVEKFDKATIHDNHVARHHIACDRCHKPIEHRQVKMVRTLEVSCATCHSNTHDPHRDMYMGVGAKGIEPSPDVMFKAQVGCDGCHREKREVRAMAGSVEGETATFGTRSACVACHGEGFDGMLDKWQALLKTATEGVEARRALVKDLPATVVDEAARKDAGERLERADYNLKFLREGHGEHNILYAERILVAVQSDLDAILKIAKPGGEVPASALGFDPAPITAKCTQTCHTNMDKILKVKYQDLELSHRDHITKHGLQCIYCHDNSERHGAVRLQKKSCVHCHHTQQTSECGDACHGKQVAFRAGVGAALDVPKTPDVMVDQAACKECHVDIGQGNDTAKIREACVGCHDEKYRAMPTAWQEEIRKRLDVAKAGVGAAELAKRLPLKSLVKAKGDLAVIEEDRSGGAHNPAYARKILDAIDKLLKGDDGEFHTAMEKEPVPTR